MKKTFEEKYEIVGVEPGIHHVAGFGKIDLVNLDVEEADNLHKLNFPFLKLKANTPAAKKIEA